MLFQFILQYIKIKVQQNKAVYLHKIFLKILVKKTLG